MRLVKGNPYVAATVLAIVVLAVLLVAGAIDLNSGLPFNLGFGVPPTRDYTLNAAFTDANGLYPGANVEIAGADVGQVTGVRIKHDQALVSMRIYHKYGPLHRGTIASIRYTTLLAQKYVELTPSAGTPALAGGATIPSEQTVTPVDFDQFLSSLDARTRHQVQVLVQQLGGGVTGEKASINALLDNLSVLAEQSPPSLDVLKTRDPQLASILDNLDTVASRLAASHAQLGQLVANTAQVNETLARSDRNLDGLLVHLASVSQDTSQTLRGNEGNLRTTVDRLDPLLTGLNPNLSITAGYFDQAAPTLKAEATYLIPEVVSAISQQDAGGNYLRQFVVINTCTDTIAPSPIKPPKGGGPTGGCLLPAVTGLASPSAGHSASPSAAPKPNKKKKACPPSTASPSTSPSPLLNLGKPSPSASSSPGCRKKRSHNKTPRPSPSPSTPSPSTHGSPFGPFGNLFGGGL